jgi:hypothetical protein
MATGSFWSRVTLIEGAVAFALSGSLLAVAVPAFCRSVELSYATEPVAGLERIHRGAGAYAAAHAGTAARFPPTVAQTPAVPPRGTRELDPPGIWDHATWVAIAFRAAPEGVPHRYAFAFTSTFGAEGSSFVATSRGDLDGDGVLSTFEIRATEADLSTSPVLHIESERE